MSRKLAKKQDMLNQLEQKQKKKDADGDYSGDEYDDGMPAIKLYIKS